MHDAQRFKPHVTVAAIIERDGRFLLVEEHTPHGLRFNNPAGHLEPAESLLQACTREVLEETAHDFVPTALSGIYLSDFPQHDPVQHGDLAKRTHYLRFAFVGDLGAHHAAQALDAGIVRSVWLSLDEIRACAHLRSPLVLRCIEDYVAGQRYPLSMLHLVAVD